MNILFISRQFYPCIGGTETYMLQSALRLQKLGCNIKVLTLDRDLYRDTRLPIKETYKGIRIYRRPFVQTFLKPFVPGITPVLSRLIRWCDIVHHHDLRLALELSLLLAGTLKKPLILTTHGLIFHQAKNLKLKQAVFRHYLGPILSKADAIHAVSEQDAARTAEVVPSHRIHLIPGGVDIERFSDVSLNPAPSRIFYFGRLQHNKGVDYLVRALAELPADVRLDLAYGSFEEPYLSELKNLAAKLRISDRIRWLGRLSNDELDKFISSSQLVTLPSRYEGFGLTALEVMAAGGLVVANNIPTYRKLIENGKNGFIVDFGDTASTVVRLKELLRISPEDRKRIAREAKEVAREFDWEHRANQIMELYQHLRY